MKIVSVTTNATAMVAYAGQPFDIVGEGFATGITARWGCQNLPIVSVTPTVLKVKAPTEVYGGDVAAIVLTLGADSVLGPTLTILPVGGTPPPPPDLPAPANLVAQSLSASAITLTWGDASTNETGFEVERKVGNAAFTRIATTPANTVTYPDTLLFASTPYTYRVRAVKGTQVSAYSNESTATTKPAQPPPSGAPVLEAIEPGSGAPGSTVVFIGSNFGSYDSKSKAGLIWTVTGGVLYKFPPLTWTPTRVTMKVPVQGAFPGAITGPVFLRRADEQRTEALMFKVGGVTPPPPPPPSDDLAMCRDVIVRTNALRATKGLAPLRISALTPKSVLEGRVQNEGVVEVEGTLTSWTNNFDLPYEITEDDLRTLSAMAENASCMKAAQDYAKLMVDTGTFAHTGPDGSTPGVRMNRAGWSGSDWGENIANGFSTPEAVMLAWVNSPGHLANLIGPSFTVIGVGKVGGMWVMDLGNGGGTPPPVSGLAITGYSAYSVKMGQQVTITGSGFRDSLVELDGLDLRIVSLSPTTITVFAPVEPMTGTIVVRQGNEETAGPSLEVN